MAVMLLILLGMFVVFPVALFFGLRWIAFRSLRQKRSALGLGVVTIAGFALYACLVLVLAAIVFAYQTQPHGRIGTFLHQPGGVVVAVLLALAGCSLAEWWLRRVGHPTVRVRGSRDV